MVVVTRPEDPDPGRGFEANRAPKDSDVGWGPDSFSVRLSGFQLVVFLVLILLGLLIAGYLVINCERDRATSLPLSPKAQKELAQRQLAEVRLKRHVFGREARFWLSTTLEVRVSITSGWWPSGFVRSSMWWSPRIVIFMPRTSAYPIPDIRTLKMKPSDRGLPAGVAAGEVYALPRWGENQLRTLKEEAAAVAQEERGLAPAVGAAPVAHGHGGADGE